MHSILVAAAHRPTRSCNLTLARCAGDRCAICLYEIPLTAAQGEDTRREFTLDDESSAVPPPASSRRAAKLRVGMGGKRIARIARNRIGDYESFLSLSLSLSISSDAPA